ncbi:hypothetical protein [Kitasatospora viridis]|nr:hypothetical protein [Kitasatospora viridis]
MDEDEQIYPADLLGRRLLRVTTSWHRHGGAEPALLHLWLHLADLGPVRFHTPGEQLELTVDQPHGPYSMGEHGSVSVLEDSPEVAFTRFLGQPVCSVRDVEYRNGPVEKLGGLTFQFPGGTVHLLAFQDELVITEAADLGAVDPHLHEDVTLVRVERITHGFPAQWYAWTTAGRRLLLHYRHGTGTVEHQISEDGTDCRDWTSWEDGTGRGEIELAAFLDRSGLRLAPGAEVSEPGAAGVRR